MVRKYSFGALRRARRFSRRWVSCRSAPFLPGRGVRDARSGCEFVLAVDDHLLTGLQSAVDQSLIVFGLRNLDRPHLDGFIRLDDIGVSSLRPALHDA